MLGDLFDTTSAAHAQCPTLHLAARLTLGSIRAWADTLSNALTPNPPPLASSALAAHVALLARENLVIAKFIQTLTASAHDRAPTFWCPQSLTDVLTNVNAELLRHTDSVPYADASAELAVLQEWATENNWKVVHDVPVHAGTVSLIFDVEDPEGKAHIAKVSRCGIQERLRASVEEAWLLVPLVGYLGGVGVDTAQQGLDSIGDMLLAQTNIAAERRNCVKFASICKHIKGLVVPQPVDATDELLIVERYDGVALHRLPENSGAEFARICIKAWIVSSLLHCLVHTDPHAGNILFNQTDHTVGVVDFGLVYEATDEERERLSAALAYAVEQSDEVEEYRIEQMIADVVIQGLLEPHEAIDHLEAEERLVLRDSLANLLKRVMRGQDLGLMSPRAFWSCVRGTPGCEKVTISRFGIQLWQSAMTLRTLALALCDGSPVHLLTLIHETARELLHLDLFDLDIAR
jgi:hypothetical protein